MTVAGFASFWEEEMLEGTRILEGSMERRLKKGDTFQVVFTSIVLVGTLGVLLLDRFGPDSIMSFSLALFMAARIVEVKEGVAGFANEGVLTVMALFVVAEGITKTGALDWYMTKLLGKPKSLAVAQFRMMLPVAAVSAFFNNTPIIVIMIPVVLKWCKHANIPVQQMMLPLAFSTILGGTVTTIGTSTNLVVTGLLRAKDPKNPEYDISLFDLTPYGLPFAVIGLAYIMLASPFLLPCGPYSKKVLGVGELKIEDSEDVLLRARVTPWSPAVGRSVKRSGLRESGGIFLVSVERFATGNVHRAVSQDFILSANDILFFSGLVEKFGEFCEEHGLEVITNEVEAASKSTTDAFNEPAPETDAAERLRTINRLTDIIKDNSLYDEQEETNPQVVVTADNQVVLVGIDANDRPGLLMDVSKVLFGLHLGLHHTEAAVVRGRSVSVWRCENLSESPADTERICSVLKALLEGEIGAVAVKRQGLGVVRAQVTLWSSIAGRTLAEVNFRTEFKAAVIAVQQDGKNVSQPLSTVRLAVGDVLVLQVSDDSILLTPPPEDFYTDLAKGHASTASSDDEHDFDHEVGDAGLKAKRRVWTDLRVSFTNVADDGVVLPREFLTAMVVAPNSMLASKSIVQNGLDKLPSVLLISTERPVNFTPSGGNGWLNFAANNFFKPADRVAVTTPAAKSDDPQTVTEGYTAIAEDDPLQEGDVLWYSGTANALSDLRRIPGLLPLTNGQVAKLSDKLHDRRLIEAVVARSGPLVGKTVKETAFRTNYGAVVIGVHREGKRIHDYPGNIKLRAGDVLLLEAGPHFVDRRNNEKSFTLFREVDDSAPPRLHLIVPAALIMATMIAVYVGADISLLICATIAGAVMVMLGILSEAEARESLNWPIYVTIASAFGIGTAMANSGVAGYIAKFLVRVGNRLGVGDAGIIGAVYVATTLISEVVTNNAAAALVFPIAFSAAKESGISPRILSFAVMLGASEFATPYGYQVNLLVYEPGRYRFIDYLRFGGPLQIVLLITASICLALPLRVWWAPFLIALLVLLVISAIRVAYDNELFSFGSKKDVKHKEVLTAAASEDGPSEK